jgi:3-deoxy-D-manno-octulosonate cytidylyltransferase
VPDEKAVIGVIPARYGSTRFPGKPLALIAGKPMIQHVYERTSRARTLSEIVVATDDERILKSVEGFGGRAMMSAQDHPTGTDRVVEVAALLEAPYYVNIQGDEPLIEPDWIDMCADMLLAGAEMATLVAPIKWRMDLFDQNVVKVVTTDDGRALYFSRSPIPFPRKYLDRGMDVDLDSSRYVRHVGVYGYSRETLRRLGAAGVCEIEQMESLEQLRALWLGIEIKIGQVDRVTQCVDVPGDIARIEAALETGEA